MRRVRRAPHSLAGAYALDALADRERSRFERHMARCWRCARDVSELHSATIRLAETAACEPPSELTERALVVAARTRQLPPSWPAVPPRRARVPRVRVPRLALAITAAAVAGAVISGVTAVVSAHRLSEQQQRGHAIAVVLTAPDATLTSAPVTTGGTATIVMSRRYHELVFAASGLAALPPSRCYELWLMGPDGDRPAGMLPAPRHGMTGPVTAAGLAAGDHLGLTIEPAGGGRRPGSNVILVVAL
jgi:anti-sigma-K factor RskA